MGTVTVAGTVSVGNTVTVEGTVSVGNTVAVTVGTVTVAGTVSVGNTVTVEGTVSVGNTVAVTVGTVTVAGTVSVGNTVTVEGTVSVGNTVAVTVGTVTVAGTVSSVTTGVGFTATSTAITTGTGIKSVLQQDTSQQSMYSYYIKNNDAANAITVVLQVSPTDTDSYFVNDVSPVTLEKGSATVLTTKYYMNYTRLYYDTGTNTANLEAYFNGRV
ncbi:DUF6385 domain-containing protein [Clostridium sp. 001]|uniref:DUF6385 domain-containing protein n=1 Tax=Clostridium sp. 001 TaxID=1970093 RepID=UPI001C2C27AE|nr:DUF6385 domain-containing protein [Clostridium sp. 001]QXE19691.1 hypothetical protein B5S50_13130 [Clostridium sp. 001]